MCHQLSFWYKALRLQIPRAVTMNGGIYLWNDGRETPDRVGDIRARFGKPVIKAIAIAVRTTSAA